MEDILTYTIQIRGPVEEHDLQDICPPGLTLHPLEICDTRLTFRTDQAGLVGAIRHLHGLGLAIVRVDSQNP